jgi:hypothetical protein
MGLAFCLDALLLQKARLFSGSVIRTIVWWKSAMPGS